MISHYQVALYSARRDEMVEAVQSTLFYMNPDAPIPVHSTYAALPYEVCTFLQINFLVIVLISFCSNTEDFPWSRSHVYEGVSGIAYIILFKHRGFSMVENSCM